MRNLIVVAFVFLFMGCDSSSVMTDDMEDYSGSWASGPIELSQDGITIDATYVWSMTVDETGAFEATLWLEHDEYRVSKIDSFAGTIVAPIISVKPVQFANSIGRLESSAGFSGQISMDAITFEQDMSKALPNGTLRLYKR